MSLRAGKLRHRVTIETFTESQDSDYGEPTKTWSADTNIGNDGVVWAEVLPQRGREVFDAEQEVANVDTLIRTRFHSGITPEHRVVWGSHTYDIETVLDQMGRGRELHLLCNEVNPAST